MCSPETFLTLFAALLAAYPETAIQPNTPQVFLAALADIPDEDLSRAVADHIAHHKRFPAIAELREQALAGRYPSESEAWAEVKRAFRACGRDQTPTWSHPLIGQVVAALGWRSLCDSTLDNEPTDRAHFFRLYRALIDRETFHRTSFTLALGASGDVPLLPPSVQPES